MVSECVRSADTAEAFHHQQQACPDAPWGQYRHQSRHCCSGAPCPWLSACWMSFSSFRPWRVLVMNDSGTVHASMHTTRKGEETDACVHAATRDRCRQLYSRVVESKQTDKRVVARWTRSRKTTMAAEHSPITAPEQRLSKRITWNSGENRGVGHSCNKQFHFPPTSTSLQHKRVENSHVLDQIITAAANGGHNNKNMAFFVVERRKRLFRPPFFRGRVARWPRQTPIVPIRVDRRLGRCYSAISPKYPSWHFDT